MRRTCQSEKTGIFFLIVNAKKLIDEQMLKAWTNHWTSKNNIIIVVFCGYVYSVSLPVRIRWKNENSFLSSFCLAHWHFFRRLLLKCCVLALRCAIYLRHGCKVNKAYANTHKKCAMFFFNKCYLTKKKTFFGR